MSATHIKFAEKLNLHFNENPKEFCKKRGDKDFSNITMGDQIELIIEILNKRRDIFSKVKTNEIRELSNIITPSRNVSHHEFVKISEENIKKSLRLMYELLPYFPICLKLVDESPGFTYIGKIECSSGVSRINILSSNKLEVEKYYYLDRNENIECRQIKPKFITKATCFERIKKDAEKLLEG